MPLARALPRMEGIPAVSKHQVEGATLEEVDRNDDSCPVILKPSDAPQIASELRRVADDIEKGNIVIFSAHVHSHTDTAESQLLIRFAEKEETPDKFYGEGSERFWNAGSLFHLRT